MQFYIFILFYLNTVYFYASSQTYFYLATFHLMTKSMQSIQSQAFTCLFYIEYRYLLSRFHFVKYVQHKANYIHLLRTYLLILSMHTFLDMYLTDELLANNPEEGY